LSQTDLRYSRQTLLPEIGEVGQQKLNNAKVLIIGAGGLGSPAALYLTGAGVGTLLIADGDSVDVTNLHRQILYRQDNCGDSKSDSAEQELNKLNSDVIIESIDDRLDAEGLDYYISEVDVVLDCTDNLNTRLMINRACYAHSVPLVLGAAVGWDGQLTVYNFASNSQCCYQCLFGSDIPQQQASCSQLGIMGPVVGIVGVAQALEAIKLINGMSSSTHGGLHLFDGRTFSWQKMKLAKHPHCPVCG